MIDYKGWMIFGPDEDCYNDIKRYIGEGVLFSDYKEDLTPEINIPKMRVYRILAGINTNSSHPYQTTVGVLTGWKYIAIKKQEEEVKIEGKPEVVVRNIPDGKNIVIYQHRGGEYIGWSCSEGVYTRIQKRCLLDSDLIPWRDIDSWELVKKL